MRIPTSIHSRRPTAPALLLRRLAFELRLSISWAWLLPPVGMALVFVVLNTSGTPTNQYATVVRQSLEIGLPLLGVFLAVPLLEREWSHGTLAQLALRRPLLQVLYTRLALVGIYLFLVAAVASLFGWLGAPGSLRSPLVAVGWLAASLFIALAPTFALVALALLTAHAFGSAAAGYLVAVAAWIGSVSAALLLPPDEQLRAFLLFSWSFPAAGDPSNWHWGKFTLLAVALALSGTQFLCLRQEARFIRNSRE